MEFKEYMVLSRLLDYPDEELINNLELVEETIESLATISPEERTVLRDFLFYFKSKSLVELQGEYVDTFDMTPNHSLHLTHHLLGDDNKERGPALIELTEYFKGLDLEAKDGELPDYLPLILEYAAVLSKEESDAFISQATSAISILAQSLKKVKSPYAPLIRFIERRGNCTRQAA